MKKVTCLEFFLILLFITSIGCVIAQDQISAVKENDFFKYEITAYWSSENSTRSEPADLLKYNNTRNYEVDITSVSGPNVTTTETWRFQDSTENQVIVVQNVDTGESYIMKGLSKIFGANLQSGDLAYPSGNETWRVNQTEIREYDGMGRETNIITFSEEVTNSKGAVSATSRIDYLFDKETGMLVERRDYFQSSEESVSIIMTLTETNRWSINQNSGNQIEFSFPMQIAVIILAAILISSVGIYVYQKSNRNKKKKRR